MSESPDQVMNNPDELERSRSNTESSEPLRVVDAHTDLLLELVHRQAEDDPFGRLWLDQLRDGGVGVQLCPMYLWWDNVGERAIRSALEQVIALDRAVEQHPDVEMVTTSADLDRVWEEGRLGLILAAEGAELLGNDPRLLEIYWRLGLRVLGPVHARRNAYADGNAERSDGGLSELGRRLVSAVDRIGMTLDLAHASAKTFSDAMSIVGGRVIVSHAGCRALCDDPRNLSDVQLRILADAGGVVGIFAVAPYLGSGSRSIELVADHILHACEVVGPEHVGLGGDFMHQLLHCEGLVRRPPGSGYGFDDADIPIVELTGPGQYPELARTLERRGVTRPELADVFGGNFLRFFQRALPKD